MKAVQPRPNSFSYIERTGEYDTPADSQKKRQVNENHKARQRFPHSNKTANSRSNRLCLSQVPRLRNVDRERPKQPLADNRTISTEP